MATPFARWFVDLLDFQDLAAKRAGAARASGRSRRISGRILIDWREGTHASTDRATAETAVLGAVSSR